MAHRIIFWALLLLSVGGCASYRKELDANPPFTPHRFSSYDLEVAWKTEQSDGGLRLAGAVTNRRDYFLHDLELTARLVDREGKVLARETYTDFPTYVPPGKEAPFRMELRLPAGGAVERIRFSYVYWLAEPPPAFRGYGDVPYFGSFDSPP